MRHATFRQLKVFEATARHLSFTRAAEELHLTQPTVSMQIKQLTGTVSMPLFEQIGKRIHLTGAGQELHATCREIFDSIERFEMDVANRKGFKKGRLRLAVITTAEYFAPRLLHKNSGSKNSRPNPPLHGLSPQVIAHFKVQRYAHHEVERESYR